jgi:hypothetical protein
MLQRQLSHSKSSLLMRPVLKTKQSFTLHFTPIASLRLQVPVPSPYNRNIFHILFCRLLQDLHIDVSLLSGIHQELHESLCISNYHFCRNDGLPGRKRGTAVSVRKGIAHNHVDLPPLVSKQATDIRTIVNCYLRQSLRHQVTPGMIQTSLNYQALD